MNAMPPISLLLALLSTLACKKTDVSDPAAGEAPFFSILATEQPLLRLTIDRQPTIKFRGLGELRIADAIAVEIIPTTVFKNIDAELGYRLERMLVLGSDGELRCDSENIDRNTMLLEVKACTRLTEPTPVPSASASDRAKPSPNPIETPN